ncbi:6-phospho-3-hexuloisomerase [Tenuibacillus multivorans]|uniref:6-phospho-3-hexuloisomerase n=1 Tax=Tenuibacillus multivorans TaxID=237069 RepID=A0A1H0C1S9_9BACI|nr:6-phospho-3-hexuloisomerase [Tenuibacillus multivorans]GEL77734.1 6-phospho 3-hexuloisomerase [Tenuibacillus multivorans]SDN51853.1 6-phospho-3-hexuloisomerase [Tenuibacillus multivorans]
MKDIITKIAGEISDVLNDVNDEEVTQLAEAIQSSNRVFVAGTGRSGLVARMFAMRLMHSGYTVYVVGETITPSIEEEDLLIVISGSGGTASLVQKVEKAREVGVNVALVTTNSDSPIGKLSDYNIVIPAATKKQLTNRDTIQPLGSQFDQAAHLLLDSIIVYLLEQTTSEQAFLNKKHANLE